MFRKPAMILFVGVVAAVSDYDIDLVDSWDARPKRARLLIDKNSPASTMRVIMYARDRPDRLAPGGQGAAGALRGALSTLLTSKATAYAVSSRTAASTQRCSALVGW